MIRRVLSVTALLTVSAFSIMGCEKVETGNTGIEKSIWGTVASATLPPGLYQTWTRDIFEVSGKEDTISFADLHPKSKDNLTMEDLDIDITVQIDPTKAAMIYTRFSNDLHYHKEIGAYVVGTNYISRQARAVIFQVVANHGAQTMHQHRQELENEITSSLQKELDHDMGQGWVNVRNVNIRNLVTDKNVEDSIRKIAAAQFETQQKIMEQAKATEEAKRLLIETEGRAKAAARTLEIEAQGKANANRTIRESLTPELLQALQIEMVAKFADKDSKATTVLLPTGQPVTPMISVNR